MHGSLAMGRSARSRCEVLFGLRNSRLKLAFAVVFGAACSEAPLESRAPGPGTIAWRVAEIRSPLDATELAADAMHVYAYRDGLSISAVRLSDQRIAWTARSDETFDNEFAPRGLARCGATVVFGSPSALYGVTPDSGRRLWRWRPSKGGALGYGAPSCSGSTIYFGTGRPMYIYAIDANSGTERWASDVALDSLANGFARTPRVSDGVVVACTREFTRYFTGAITGIDAGTGQRLWRHTWTTDFRTGDASCAAPIAAGGGLAIGAADDGRIFALDLHSGITRWTAPRIAAYQSNDQRPALISDGVLLAGSLSGAIIAFDLETGAERWRSVDARGSAYSAISNQIAFARGTAIGTNTSGFALAFDIRTGKQLWSFAGGQRENDQLLFGPGVMTDSLLITVGSDGLYALRW